LIFTVQDSGIIYFHNGKASIENRANSLIIFHCPHTMGNHITCGLEFEGHGGGRENIFTSKKWVIRSCQPELDLLRS
jgi:hypothetical protein